VRLSCRHPGTAIELEATLSAIPGRISQEKVWAPVASECVPHCLCEVVGTSIAYTRASATTMSPSGGRLLLQGCRGTCNKSSLSVLCGMGEDSGGVYLVGRREVEGDSGGVV
jgi:hypothetical protein